MKIVNIRHGFATNSSSVHSIVLGSFGISRERPDEMCHSFGWEAFVLGTPEAKRAYFAQLLMSALPYKERGDLGDRKAAEKVFKLFYSDELEAEVKEHIMAELIDGYVDHQSVPSLPRLRNGEIAFSFFKDLAEYFVWGDYTVVGGNDNDGLDHMGQYVLLERVSSLDSLYKGLVIEYDWGYSLFNPLGGTRVRFAKDFSRYTGKTSVPELVDMKITSFCDNRKQCSQWCYQKSGTHGKHADFNRVVEYIDTLAEAGTFEIAFGGGEPTTHPQFKKILKATRERGIVPNFSSSNLAWFTDKRNVALLDVVGQVGFSIERWEDIPPIFRLLGGKVSFHYTLDAFPWKNYEEILEKVPHWVTLTVLGFKENKIKAPYRNEGWLDAARESGSRLSIDTTIAKQYPEEVAGLNPILYETEEGKSSMYIDAVSDQCGASSYGKTEACTPADFLEKFKRY